MAAASFGKYRLIAELGHGGMADVFLAVQAGPLGSGFSKLTVVKRLRANLAEDPDFISMLVDEARIAARLNHPNVVQTNEIGEVDERYFIAMEYLDGQPFHRIQHRAAKADAPAKLTKEMQYLVLMDVLSGLHHAHELTDYDGTKLDIVHRDVTPHNIFVTYEGQVKVVDFGIAKASGRASETRQGVVKGKVRYMAPEQAMGREIDRRADIFAAGVILWEIAAGRRLWKDMDDFRIVQALIAQDVPRSPKAVDAAVPDAIDAICRRALGKIEERFDTAEEMREAIEQYLTDANVIVQARRKLPHVVSELFTDKRAEIRAIIETQLAMLHTRPSIELKTFPVPDSMASGGTPLSPTPASRVAASGATSLSAPSSGGTPLPVAVDEARNKTGNTDHPTLHPPRSNPSMPIESTQLSGPRPRRSLAALAGVGAVGALLATAVGMAWSNRTASSADGDGPMPVTSAEPADSTEVGLRVTATPADALVRVDDAAPQRLPLDINVPKDAREHRLHFEAPGYVSKTETVSFARDISLGVVLDKASAPGASSVKTAAKAPAVAAAWSPSKTSHAAAPKGDSAAATPPGTVDLASTVSPPHPERKGSSRLGLDKSDPWSGK